MDNSNDKKKIFILRTVIAFIILLIILFSVVAILDFQSDKSDPKYLSTTTRRTYKKESTTTTKFVMPSTSESTTTEPITTTTTIKQSSNTQKTTTARSTAKPTTRKPTTRKPTTRKPTTTKIQTIPDSPIPEVPKYTQATGPTRHANAEDSWEWYIANKINDIRASNGLNRLIVATELREFSESAGDVYFTQGENAVENYLDGYNNYRFWTVNRNIDKDYLVNNTIEATSVTTNKYYKYVGVGVIKHIDGQNGLPSYHYCIIYQ